MRIGHSVSLLEFSITPSHLEFFKRGSFHRKSQQGSLQWKLQERFRTGVFTTRQGHDFP